MKKVYLLCIYFAAIFLTLSTCNSASEKAQEVQTTDTTSTVSVDSIAQADSSGRPVLPIDDDNKTDTTSTDKKQATRGADQKGFAIVNCPGVMIKGIPGIVVAQVTKKELQTAIKELVHKLYQQDSSISKTQISKETYGDSILLFKKMKVVLEVDNDDIKKISANNDIVQDFTNKQTLEWKWTIKPLIKKEKTIVTFNFYGIDDNNQELTVLQKSMSIGVEIDVRTFWDRWIDFLFDDAKTTITAILIPFITFLGGLFFGKRKEKK